MKISVLLPTWKRPEKLRLALESLVNQNRAVDEVVAVYRDIDTEARQVLSSFATKLPLIIIEVKVPGVIAAENAALKNSTGDIICFLDDDAEAPTKWIELIEQHFIKDSSLAGVGGPDLITGDDPSYRKIVSIVGKVKYYGKIIGNHHHEIKNIVSVDVLKGVNMAFRREVLPFLDDNLQSNHDEGNGSHWELDICLQIKKTGRKLLFDPSLEVKHHSNHSHFVLNKNTKNNARNMVYVILKNFDFCRKVLFFLYVFFLGNTQIIGAGKYLQLIFQKGPFKATNDYFYSTLGFIIGIKTYFLR